MTGRFKFEILAKYPHMKPNDIVLWEKFVAANANFFDSMDYDVLVGVGTEMDTEVVPGGDVNALYQKKIDAVGYRKGETWIIEIRPNAGVRGLGDVAVYDNLYIETFKPTDRIVNALLTDRTDPDMERLAAEWKIEIIVV